VKKESGFYTSAATVAAKNFQSMTIKFEQVIKSTIFMPVKVKDYNRDYKIPGF
jgi:hypothetical protein